jgi:hypothetical protein
MIAAASFSLAGIAICVAVVIVGVHRIVKDGK